MIDNIIIGGKEKTAEAVILCGVKPDGSLGMISIDVNGVVQTAGSFGGGAPSGSAGGALGGTYPNPTVVGVITPTSVKIGAGGVITSSGAGGVMGSNAFTSGGLVSDGQQIFDGSHVLAGNFGARTLLSTNGTTSSVDWGASILYDSAGNESVAWDEHAIYYLGTKWINWDAGGQLVKNLDIRADWSGDAGIVFPHGIFDGSGNDTIDTSQRRLYCNDGTTVALDWSNPSTVVAKAHALSAYAAGSVYTLTNSDALVHFGTTDPTLVIDQVGTYLLLGRAYLKYNGATYAATQTATMHLRRTNNTPADVANATTTATMRVITTITDSVGIMSLPGVIYTTANTTDSISVYGSVSATPSVGSVQCTEASIVAIRLF